MVAIRMYDVHRRDSSHTLAATISIRRSECDWQDFLHSRPDLVLLVLRTDDITLYLASLEVLEIATLSQRSAFLWERMGLISSDLQLHISIWCSFLWTVAAQSFRGRFLDICCLRAASRRLPILYVVRRREDACLVCDAGVGFPRLPVSRHRIMGCDDDAISQSRGSVAHLHRRNSVSRSGLDRGHANVLDLCCEAVVK